MRHSIKVWCIYFFPFALLLAPTLAKPQTAPTAVANGEGDAMYQALRNVGPGQSFAVDDFTLKIDAGEFHLGKGTLTFLAPVDNQVTGVVYIGDGHFKLTPATPIERDHLVLMTKSPVVNEDFDEVVFRFTPGMHRYFLGALKGKVDGSAVAAAALKRCEEKLRHRNDQPKSETENLLYGEDMNNLEAELLASLYNPARPGFIEAYIHGRKRHDLRFSFRPTGAIPSMLAPEEVALVNNNVGAMDDGVLYLAHLTSEYQTGAASSSEDKRALVAKKFAISTTIGNNDKFDATTAITLTPRLDGERVVKLILLRTLRVNGVTGPDGKPEPFIQEDRHTDGTLYVILRVPLARGKDYTIQVAYSGDKVIQKAGGGSFFVGARESWYPSLHTFQDKATYDLTFQVPSKYRLISIGKMEDERVEGKTRISHWVMASPVPVAGFNYGAYKEISGPEMKNFEVSGYALPELPDFLRGAEGDRASSQFGSQRDMQQSALSGMSTAKMTRFALSQTAAQIQLCTYYFGKPEFDRISITEQPDFNFGQSWPTLVYLPILAYMDTTQRWRLLNQLSKGLDQFVEEVTPHEVAHQWWGHTVMWATYHDQWLSEGFAQFSAGLFLEKVLKDEKSYAEFWTAQRKEILDKNEYGLAANDAGPIWMSERLATPRTRSAYNRLVYPKGAFVLEMIRSMMWNGQDGDKAFIDMMHDFVNENRERSATTENFKAVVDRHMSPAMDLAGTHSMDWFFNEWVYGTEIPSYTFDYQTTAEAGGKAKLHISLAQSGVAPNFAMLVPVFGDFNGHTLRIAQLPIQGDATRVFDLDLPMMPQSVKLNALNEVLTR